MLTVQANELDEVSLTTLYPGLEQMNNPATASSVKCAGVPLASYLSEVAGDKTTLYFLSDVGMSNPGRFQYLITRFAAENQQVEHLAAGRQQSRHSVGQ